MNYDSLYYDVLMPVTLMLRPFAAAIMGMALCWQWFRATWSGLAGKAVGWPDALFCLLVYAFLYVPVPDPGKVVGLGLDFSAQNNDYDRTTVAIFLTERISFGVDSLITDILSFDTTISAQPPDLVSEHLGDANPPSALLNFLVLRAQFVVRFAGMSLGSVMGNANAREGAGGGILEAVLSGDPTAFLIQQMSLLLYQAGSFLALLLAYLVLGIVSVFLFLLAGLTRFGALLIFAVALFGIPIGYFRQGLKALWTAAGMVFVYIFLKGGIIIVIWCGFFILEGVVLQHYRELAYGDASLTNALTQLAPGAVFTPSGGDLLTLINQHQSIVDAEASIGMTLITFIIVLIAVVFISFKIPALISALFGIQGHADDAITSGVFIGASVATLGGSLVTKVGDAISSGRKKENRMEGD